MLMAAGLGKRMRPLTATTPKPLVRVAGKPLIDRALDRLEEAGVARAVVNVHYLADAIEAHVGARKAPAVTFSDEREQLLETGGGMVKAAAAGQLPDPFFACNADSIWLDGPQNAFSDLSAGWDPERMDALLLLVTHARAHNFDGSGDFYMDPRWPAHAQAARPDRALHLHLGSSWYRSACCAMHRTASFRPMSCGIARLPKGGSTVSPFTGRWYEVGTPAHIRPTEEALKGG
jgi:MurNAc alpha-1-phosphate uridylyltransferase